MSSITYDLANPTRTSPKTVASGVAGLVAPGILAALQYLQTGDGQTLFHALPPVLVVVIAALVSGAASFVAGWIKSDPAKRNRKLSPKVLAATAGTIVATAVLAGLQFLQTDEGQSIFAALPPALVVIIGAVIPGVASYVAGYAKTDQGRGLDPDLDRETNEFEDQDIPEDTEPGEDEDTGEYEPRYASEETDDEDGELPEPVELEDDPDERDDGSWDVDENDEPAVTEDTGEEPAEEEPEAKPAT